MNTSEITVIDEEEQIALEAVKIVKLKKKINAKAWSSQLENLMKIWGEKAAGSRELHENAAKTWSRFSDKVYIPLIFMSTIAGVGNFGAASSTNTEYWMYAIGIINIVSAFTASVAKYYKPDEKAQAHRSIAKNFGSFYRMMTLELGTSREDRMSSDELSKWAKNEYDRLQKESPSLPNSVIKRFKEKHDTQTNLPDVVLDDFCINIYGRNTDLTKDSFATPIL